MFTSRNWESRGGVISDSDEHISLGALEMCGLARSFLN